ncbi:sensor histidine kinase [Janibacter melonis]|uniref:sensor histidine kinase n=1 Tax=Janibacter melonis TaxID=262209 RepID=UPI001E5B7137|nr:sensor histidine kinase [Janibacter melonis]MCB5992041.1 sensor histidine kinase [Janibacter melonis]
MDTPALGGPLARHPRVVDALVVGPLLLLGVLPATLAAVGPEVDGPGVPAGLVLVVTLLQVVPLWWRRTRPEVAAAVVVLAHLAQLPLTDGPLPSNVAAPFAAYAVAAWSGSRPARLAVLVVCVFSGGLGVADWWDPELSAVPQVINAIFFSAVASLCWAWGDLTRRRRELLERLHEQNLALRRDRDQRVRIAAQDERTRIAREMHDVVAHSLAVVVVQADGGAYAATSSPQWDREQATQTLETIAATAREALAETRRLVGVLRADELDGYAPTESVADLPALVHRVRSSGLPVELVSDDLDGVSRDVGLAALRIVQEALTNVIKHAGPGAIASVRVRRDDGLCVTVEDDGRGAAATDDGQGYGVVGMRERASALGGHLTAGPRAGGGYLVTAHLPEDPGPTREDQP